VVAYGQSSREVSGKKSLILLCGAYFYNWTILPAIFAGQSTFKINYVSHYYVFNIAEYFSAGKCF
jgi:hypothetical protein